MTYDNMRYINTTKSVCNAIIILLSRINRRKTLLSVFRHQQMNFPNKLARLGVFVLFLINPCFLIWH